MNKKFNIQHFAKLARLELSDSEKEQMQEQMTNILIMIQPLVDLDLDDIEETNFAVNLNNILREDKTNPSMPVEKVISTFPDTANNSCKVPIIIGED